MVVLRGALRRRLVKIERPKSLFGKYPYFQEQARIYNSWEDIAKASLIYHPMATGIYVPVYTKFPKKWKKKRVNLYLKRMKKRLDEIIP